MKKMLILLLLTPWVAHANNNVPPAPQGESVLLTGATLHPVSASVIENGWVLMAEGKIQSMGSATQTPPTADRTVDLTGKHIYPGLIASNTAIGLVEVAAARATNDQAEVGLVNPNVRSHVAINADSELFPVTRANGILFAHSVPQGGLITGQSAVIQLDGWTYEDMTIATETGLNVRWPDMRVATGQFDSTLQNEEEYNKQLELMLATLETSFLEAKAYSIARKNGDTPIDVRWEAMRGVFESNQPVFAHAQSVRQINHALHMAEKIGFRLVIVGGRDAWRVAKQLKTQNVSVIISPVHTLPTRRWENYDVQFTNAKKLADAGVSFAIAAGGGGFAAAHQRNLPYHAATAAAFGLDKLDALKSVTLYPAQILGVADRIGSLESGKDASLIVTNGDPLEITTLVEHAFIQGREIDLSSRHTRLNQKYEEKYRQLEQVQSTEAVSTESP